MLELSIRLVASGLLVLLSGWLGVPAFDVSWKISLFVVGYAGWAYYLDTKSVRNSGMAGFIALADAIAISIALAAAHRLDSLGVFVLVPLSYAVTRYAAMPLLMVPIVAGSMFASDNIVNSQQPSAMLYGQALGVLILGFLLQPRKAAQREAEAPLAIIDNTPDDFLQLRENFRQLRDHCREIETRSRKDHLRAELYEAKYPVGEKFHEKLGEKLRQLTGAESLALYTVAQFDELLVVRSTSGESLKALSEATIAVAHGSNAYQVSHSVQTALASLLGDRERITVATVLLQHRSRTVGMINLSHSDPKRILECKSICEELSPVVTELVVEEARTTLQTKRFRELELKYDIAVIAHGATTEEALAARVTRELRSIVAADHLGLYLFEGNDVLALSTEGRLLDPFKVLSFAGGMGVRSWTEIGAPELSVFQCSDDQRCLSSEAVRHRIGCFCVVPIKVDEETIGYLAAVSSQPGALDLVDSQVLSLIGAELGQAIMRLRSDGENQHGLVTPGEFQDLIGSKSGCLVYLETLRREQITITCGREALDVAIRQFSRRVRAKLPLGGAVCRREAGDLVVFLPHQDDGFARSWANDVAATASMIGLPALDGVRSLPLAVRAKVAVLDRQSHGFLAEASA